MPHTFHAPEDWHFLTPVPLEDSKWLMVGTTGSWQPLSMTRGGQNKHLCVQEGALLVFICADRDIVDEPGVLNVGRGHYQSIFAKKGDDM